MSTNRVRINGVLLRHGQTFLARLGTVHVTGAGRQMRLSSLTCVRVKTARAVALAADPHFLQNARVKRGVTRETLDALMQFERACNRPNLKGADAAVAVAALFLKRADVVFAEVPLVIALPNDTAVGNWEINDAPLQRPYDDNDEWILCSTLKN
jgi:hypothetical protein